MKKDNKVTADIKKLYKLDPSLAVRTAGSLGYKITAGLKRFQSKEYNKYADGDPKQASKDLEKAIKAILKEVNKAMKLAGDFLAPAIFDAFKRELNLALETKTAMPKTVFLDDLLKQKGITMDEFKEMQKKMQ